MNRGLARAEELYQDRGVRARQLRSDGKKVIGYFCSFTPVEVLTAAGVVPFRIAGSMTDQMTLVDSYLETIACPFTRSALDLALNGKCSFLDGFVVPHACDNIVKLYDIWPHYIKHEYVHFVNVPHTTSLPSSEFFEAELATFKTSLERYAGHAISSSALDEAIELHNERRRLVRQLYEMRKKDPPPISGTEMTRVLVAIVSLPVAEANDLLRAVISDVMGRGPEQHTRKATRLMICGVGNEGTAFMELVEESGVNVVVDDLCFGSKPYFYNVEASSNPLSSLAQAYLEELNCPRTYRESPGSHQEDLDNRFGYVCELARDFRAKGVILFVLRYCDTHSFDAPDLKEYLQDKGLPVLHIEEEYPIGSIARLKTRVEAFVEMLS